MPLISTKNTVTRVVDAGIRFINAVFLLIFAVLISKITNIGTSLPLPVSSPAPVCVSHIGCNYYLLALQHLFVSVILGVTTTC